MAVIASLPMYDWPEIEAATNAWWEAIAKRLGTPVPLTRIADFASLWRRPELVLSQTCGYPFTHGYADTLRLVATPHYRAEGCQGPNYRSFVFARRAGPLASFRGAVAAINSPDSMSGMLALKLVFQPLASAGKFFSRTVVSGSHLNSLAALRAGDADICAIDAVCLGLARRYRPRDLEGLHVIAQSPMAPGLPLVTIGGDVESLRRALAEAFADPLLADTRDQLLLTGHSYLGPSDYQTILDLEAAMEGAGGLELHD
ncbi:MAG: hypothetical protein FJX63_05085 [Alphaproteobacteria bacterium]|nr:hypothetical protein [Alphaproteobacteria bacterium]